MSRFSDGAGPAQERIVQTARFLGADCAVSGVVGKTDGGYVVDIRLSPVRPEGSDRTRSVQAPSVRALLDASTDAVFDLSGIRLDETRRTRMLGFPGGSDSAVEYHAKAVRALRADKPNDALYYVAESIQYDGTFRPTLKLLGQMNLAAGNEREVLAIFERLLRQAKLDEDPLDETFALIQIGMCKQRRGELSVAEKYYRAALTQAEQLGLPDQQALALGTLANLRVDQKQLDESLTLLKRRLELLESEGDRLAMGPAYFTIGLVHAAKGQIPQVLDCLDRAAKLADEVGMPSDKAAALFQTGKILEEQGRLDEALTAYQASLKLTDELETGSAYRQIAEIYERQGKLDEALEMLRKAEATLSKRKAYAPQANCLSRIARLQMKRNQPAEALKTMTEAVEILRDLKHPDLESYERQLAEMRGQGSSRPPSSP